jgi:hypothetical protein
MRKGVKGVAGCGRGKETACRSLVGKPDVKRSLGVCRRRWEDNFKTDFNETESDDVDWINLAQDLGNFLAVLNTVTEHVVVQTVSLRQY